MQNFVVGMNCITYNFADTKSRQLKRVPDNIQEMLRLAAQLSRCTKYKYRFGTSHQLINYTADGTIFDYMAGIQKVRRNFSLKKDLWFLQVHQSLDKIFFFIFQIPFSFTVELWGKQHQGMSCFDLFNPKSDKLQVKVFNLIIQVHSK